MAVRTIVGGAVTDDFPGLEDAWKILIAYTNGRVGLIIFQQYVCSAVCISLSDYSLTKGRLPLSLPRYNGMSAILLTSRRVLPLGCSLLK